MPQPVYYRDQAILFDDVEVAPDETVFSENLRIPNSHDLTVQITADENSKEVNGRLRTKPESDEPFGTKGAVIRKEDFTEDPDYTFIEDYEVRNDNFMHFMITNNGQETITINGKAFTDGEVKDV